MLVRLDIDNFKALNNFSIELTPLTVLIGENSTGKSTILQAIDLVANFAQTDLNNYLENRNWEAAALKSKLNRKGNITFKLYFELMIGGVKSEITWEVVLAIKNHHFVLVREVVENMTTNRQILKRDNKTTKLYSSSVKKFVDSLLLASERLTSIIGIVQLEEFPELKEIKDVLDGFNFFGLLSVDKMRKLNKRGQVSSIGTGGESISAFLNSIDFIVKKRIIKKLRKYFTTIKSLKVRQDPIEGWTTFDVIEQYLENGDEININANYLSDGFLRIIAFISVLSNNTKIPYNSPDVTTQTGHSVSFNVIPSEYKYALFLLEEIENGINPHLAGFLLEYMLELSEKENRQILLTTHSPIVLNYVPVENIIYLWRSDLGEVKADKVFNREDIKEHLAYMNPGEIWMNFEREELLNGQNKEK